MAKMTNAYDLPARLVISFCFHERCSSYTAHLLPENGDYRGQIAEPPIIEM